MRIVCVWFLARCRTPAASNIPTHHVLPRMDTASACADTAPFAATHVDFGCTVCFDIIQTYYHKTPLRKLIAQHKSTRPGCFVRSALIGDAELARRLEQQCEANQSRFGDGDTKGLLDTGGEFAAFQCASCARCFREKPKADDHVRSGRTSCSGSTLLPIAARVTIFGTVCPAPPACRPTGINLHLATKEQLLAELKLRDAEADDVESTYIAPREIQPFDAKQLRKVSHCGGNISCFPFFPLSILARPVCLPTYLTPFVHSNPSPPQTEIRLRRRREGHGVGRGQRGIL